MSSGLNPAIIEFESRFNVKTGTSTHLAQTGEPYIVVCSHGVKSEGDPIPYYGSQEEAIERWIVALENYARDKSGTLRAMRSIRGC